MSEFELIGDTRRHTAQLLTLVAVWACLPVGGALVGVSLITRQPELLPVGLLSLVIGAVALAQRGRPRPLSILALASVLGMLLVFTGDRVAHAAVLPSFLLFAFMGAIALPRRVSRWYGVWCGAIGVVSLYWVLPGLSAQELAVAVVMFAAIAFAGWRFLTAAADLMARSEESHRLIFQGSPVALLEEDFSEVATRLEALRVSGVEDLRAHLLEHPELVREMVSSIKIRRANRAALTMIGAASMSELLEGFRTAERADNELGPFIEQFAAIWEGRSEMAFDLEGSTLSGEPLEAVLHWSTPVRDGEMDLTRVTVAISDITPRKQIEERLTAALETNRKLLGFEHTLAMCSRSLLMGSGDEALEAALTALREAIGADRGYLAVNVEDPELGPCFRVVRSVVADEDDWVDRPMPWANYPTARETLAAGRAFQHVGNGGIGWRRSVVTVPVFIDGRWAGSVGLMDLRRSEPWPEEAVRMLEVAAPMLGAFWERETTRRRLEELIRSKDHFVASVSHELRTPLAAVLGFAEELKAKASSFSGEELTDMLQLIAEQSQEVADMVEDLLVAARADIGRVSVRPQHVYLRSQAETVLAGLGRTGRKVIQVVGGRGRAWADPTRTRQIIRNLLTNAIRYGGDRVVVEAEELGGHTLLRVTDNGPGLGREHWERIFEPYERAHDQPTQPASIGLGLTVSRQLAQLMGGDLVYRSGPEGSVFILTLPAAPPGEAAETVLAAVAGD